MPACKDKPRFSCRMHAEEQLLCLYLEYLYLVCPKGTAQKLASDHDQATPGRHPHTAEPLSVPRQRQIHRQTVMTASNSDHKTPTRCFRTLRVRPRDNLADWDCNLIVAHLIILNICQIASHQQITHRTLRTDLTDQPGKPKFIKPFITFQHLRTL